MYYAGLLEFFMSAFTQSRCVLITGASRGIGKACALEFAQKGFKLALVSRAKEAPDELLQELRSLDNANLEWKWYSCDLNDTKQIKSLCNKIDTDFQVIDVLLNNAGIYKLDGPIYRKNSEDLDFETSININLKAPYLLCRHFAQGMQERGFGRIINISSISGIRGEKLGKAYSASKFGLVGLTQSMALELAEYGVTVNCICPGWVATDMAIKQLKDPKWCLENEIPPDESIAIAELSVPQKRLLDPFEIANLASFLSADASKGITGQAITICGGLSLC